MEMGGDASWAGIAKKARAAVVLIASALILLWIFSVVPRPAFTSSEVHFTDSSPKGLAIVPASCPSPPWTENYPGECGINVVLCPNGVPAPHNNVAECPGVEQPVQCPVGYTMQNGQCVFVACPPWYVRSGNTCVLVSCPPGYVFQGGKCIVTTCPTNFVLQNGKCVAITCPTGQSPQNGACVTNGQCVVRNECFGGNLYTRGADCKATLAETCAYGCAGSSCTVPSPLIAVWEVKPDLVRKESTATIKWSATHVASCAITNTSDNVVLTGPSGETPSSPITKKTVFTITCQGLPGSTPSSVTQSATVNVAPVFQEV